MSTTPVLHHSSTPEALTEDQWTGLERTAKRLARLSWIPAAYKPCQPQGNKPGKSIEQAEAEIAAAGAFLWSIGRDLTPMTLKLVYIVNGAVDVMFDLISAQVHAHGHEMWVVDESHESATVAGQRRGSSRVHEVTFTFEDAVRAGLTERWDYKQGKTVPTETYAKWTRDMLVARAGKRCAKRVAPEALLSMPPPLNYVITDSGRVQVAEIVHEHQEDDDIVDGEIVEPEQGEDPGLTPAQMSEGGEPAGETRPASPVRPPSDPVAAGEPEGGDNGGAAIVGASTAPLPRLATGGIDWREVAKRHGVTVGGLLIRARTFAEQRGLEAPAAIEDVTDEQLVADVVDWLGEPA